MKAEEKTDEMLVSRLASESSRWTALGMPEGDDGLQKAGSELLARIAHLHNCIDYLELCTGASCGSRKKGR